MFRIGFNQQARIVSLSSYVVFLYYIELYVLVFLGDVVSKVYILLDIHRRKWS